MSIENFPAAKPPIEHADLKRPPLEELGADAQKDTEQLREIDLEIQKIDQLLAEREQSHLSGVFEFFNNSKKERQRRAELVDRRDWLIKMQPVRQRVIDELRPE